MNTPHSTPTTIGVIGASGFVGACVLQQLCDRSVNVIAYSRKRRDVPTGNPKWHQLSDQNVDAACSPSGEAVPVWICLAPIDKLSTYFKMLESAQVKRIVALSSTSRFTKVNSSDEKEKEMVQTFAKAELSLQEWAEARGIGWTILRPTLIYGMGQDRNIVEIMRFIRRFGFFPVFGKANGLRQPIHVLDVTTACVSAALSSEPYNAAYNISGSEVLSYKEMVLRVFSALNRKPRLIPIPMWLFRLAVSIVRCVPRYRKWSSAMVERMNYDMVFDHSEMAQISDFSPRKFKLSSEDIPD